MKFVIWIWYFFIAALFISGGVGLIVGTIRVLQQFGG